ncbi:MAG: hypothetical protein HY318_13975 [Armatimonadetes bacterium]|nr:hypothetical protein [Armatimonadota bacterium]
MTMTPRDNMTAAINLRTPERLPLCDSYWPATLTRWRNEGMPSDAQPFDYFGMDWRFVYLDSSLQLEEELIEETEEYAIKRNAYGATARFSRKQEVPAELLDFEIKTRRDWERLKGRLVANKERIAPTGFYSLVDNWSPPDPDWETRKAALTRILEGESYVVAYCYIGFEAVWRKIGYEQSLMTLVDNPNWIRDMIEAHTDMLVDLFGLLHEEGLRVDGAFMACDLAYRNGALISPATYRDIELPSMQRLTQALRGLGVQAIFHSDGNFEELIPLLIEGGINCIQPLEVQAGMDVRDLKTRYGSDLALMGNIAHSEMMKDSEAEGRTVIQDKVRRASEGGGYVYHSDHSVPPSVCLARYRQVLEWVREATDL